MKPSAKLPPLSGYCRPGHFAADARYCAARAVLNATRRKLAAPAPATT